MRQTIACFVVKAGAGKQGTMGSGSPSAEADSRAAIQGSRCDVSW